MNTQWNQYKTVEIRDNIKGFFLCVFDVVIIVFRGTFQMHFSKGDVLSKWQLPNVQFPKVRLGPLRRRRL